MVNKVKEYMEKQKSPQKEICQKLREIILSTYPEIIEEMKYGVPYYGEKYYIVALKTHVNLGFSIKGLIKEELALFEGGGKLTRHIKINNVDDINEEKVIKLLKMIKD